MLTTGAIFSDHMVLQREKTIPVWGYADPAVSVSVSIDTETVTGSSDETGFWILYLSPKNTARGLTLTIQGGDEKIEFHDVSTGEVWFAGGQSNMELELVNSLHGESAVALKRRCW